MTSITPDSPRNDPSVAEIIAQAEARAVADMAGATPSAELPSDDSRANYAHSRRPDSYAVDAAVPEIQLTEREKAMAAVDEMRRKFAARQLGAVTTSSEANRTSRDAARRALDARLG